MIVFDILLKNLFISLYLVNKIYNFVYLCFLNGILQVIFNFQLSLFVYSCILALIAVPIIVIAVIRNASFSAFVNDDDLVLNEFNFNNINGILTVAIIAVILFIGLKIAEFFLIIYASLKTSNGDDFKYPLTINFLK